MPRKSPKIATVIDALTAYRGAERVLAAVLEMYPEAPVHTLVYEPRAFAGTAVATHPVHTTFIQRLPAGRSQYRSYLPLLPMAIEQLDLREYDIVLSFSYAVAHGALCRPDQLHISYTFAPLRYAWQNAHQYFQSGAAAALANLIMHYFRLWDRGAATGVDHFVAISHWTAACIWRAYRRGAEVIYPPVEIDRFKPGAARGNYFVSLARLVRHKRIELIVESFSKLGLPLVVVGAGPERERLDSLAGPNVRFAGRVSNEEAAAIVSKARGLVHAAEEDFGLVLAEAQAAGCPVIAYAGGAAPEIIADGKTGVLFRELTVNSLMAAVGHFEGMYKAFHQKDCRANARRFSKARFQKQFAGVVEREWSAFRRRSAR